MRKQNSTNSQRRAILKSAAISSSVIGAASLSSEKWVKPVIDSVVLPAHAATTDDTGILPGEVGSRYSFIDPAFQPSQTALGLQMPVAMVTPEGSANSLTAKLLDMIVPSAAAAETSSLGRLELFLEITAEGSYRFVFLMSYNEIEGQYFIVFYTDGSATLGNNSLPVDLCGDDFANDLQFSVDSVTPEKAHITFGTDGESFDLLYDQNAVPPTKLACNIPV